MNTLPHILSDAPNSTKTWHTSDSETESQAIKVLKCKYEILYEIFSSSICERDDADSMVIGLQSNNKAGTKRERSNDKIEASLMEIVISNVTQFSSTLLNGVCCIASRCRYANENKMRQRNSQSNKRALQINSKCLIYYVEL